MIHTLKEAESMWSDEPCARLRIVEEFGQAVAADAALSQHRKFFEMHNPQAPPFRLGFGEPAMHWMWKLLVDTMPQNFRFLEIGVYRAQIPTLIDFCARRTSKTAFIYGITPDFTGRSEDPRMNANRSADVTIIREIIKRVGLTNSFELFLGRSQDDAIVEEVKRRSPIDLLYIDGDHTFDAASKDFENYGPMVRDGGYLVMDDSTLFKDTPFEYKGEEGCSWLTDEFIACDPGWQEILNVSHNRVFRKTGP